MTIPSKTSSSSICSTCSRVPICAPEVLSTGVPITAALYEIAVSSAMRHLVSSGAAAQQERYERRFELHPQVHFAVAFPAVGEVDGQLDDLQPVPDGPEVHLDLEAVAVAADAGHVNRFQRGSPPDLEARGHVADAEPKQRADVVVGKAGQRPAVPRPFTRQAGTGHVPG